MASRRSRVALIRQAVLAGMGAALVSTVVLALTWGLTSQEAFDSLTYRESREANREAELRSAAVRLARQDGWLDARRQAASELDRLLLAGSYQDGRAIGYDYAWNQAVDLALAASPRQSYDSEPGTQWIELRR